jgi:hypothetical protein
MRSRRGWSNVTAGTSEVIERWSAQALTSTHDHGAKASPPMVLAVMSRLIWFIGHLQFNSEAKNLERCGSSRGEPLRLLNLE